MCVCVRERERERECVREREGIHSVFALFASSLWRHGEKVSKGEREREREREAEKQCVCVREREREREEGRGGERERAGIHSVFALFASSLYSHGESESQRE